MNKKENLINQNTGHIKMTMENFVNEIKNIKSILLDVVKFKHEGVIDLLSYEYIAIRVKDNIQVGDNTYVFSKDSYVWIDLEKKQCYPFIPDGKILDNKVFNVEKELDEMKRKASISIIDQIRNKFFNNSENKIKIK